MCFFTLLICVLLAAIVRVFDDLLGFWLDCHRRLEEYVGIGLRLAGLLDFFFFRFWLLGRCHLGFLEGETGSFLGSQHLLFLAFGHFETLQGFLGREGVNNLEC